EPPVLTPAVDLSGRVGQFAGEDRTQPGRALGIGRAPALVPVPVRLQQGLLDKIRGVEQALWARVELEPGQQQQILAETLQGRTSVMAGLSHYSRPLEE